MNDTDDRSEPGGMSSRGRQRKHVAYAVGTTLAAMGMATFVFASASFAAPLPTLGTLTAAATTTAPASSMAGMAGMAATPTATPTATDTADTTDDTADDTAADDGDAQTIDIAIQNFAFAPAAVTVAVGDTVTWTNKDTVAHTVTVSSGPVSFASPNLATGESFTYTFTTPGTYSYYCAIHPGMTATVTVTGTGTGTPPATTTCIPKEVASAIIAHINAAHLETSPGDQVKGLLNVDDYVRMHTEWLEKVLAPVVAGGPTVVTQMITAIMAHINAAHLETSLGDQVKGALNADTYVLMHTEWLEKVLAPAVGQLTC